ncbi:hypothetical protein APHAL10511_003431 [Amanita phalloides]|nr:hypothetical protein APHAL10511_003431 [Amanita phalloides]
MYGLLRHNTILGHSVHLNDYELELIKNRNAGVSHCPVSNFNLRSGIAQVGKYLDLGIKVGLGTDVSGAFSPSMLSVIQHASTASKVLAFRSVLPPPPVEPEPVSHKVKFADKLLPVGTLLYLATLGGAEVCDIDKYVGLFEVGKSFDALLVSIRRDSGNLIIWNDGMKKKNPRISLLAWWSDSYLEETTGISCAFTFRVGLLAENHFTRRKLYKLF